MNGISFALEIRPDKSLVRSQSVSASSAAS
jgi:hypothetical protein